VEVEVEVEREVEREGNNTHVSERVPSLELVIADPSPAGDRGGSAQRIFNAWQTSTGKTRARLDAKRQRIIRSALKQYPEDDLIDAVQGWARSAYHAGQNERHTVYNELGLILRDAEHIEKFRDLQRGHGIAVQTAARLRPGEQALATRMAAARAREAEGA
jgi:hypothetical protein